MQASPYSMHKKSNDWATGPSIDYSRIDKKDSFEPRRKSVTKNENKMSNEDTFD